MAELESFSEMVQRHKVLVNDIINTLLPQYQVIPAEAEAETDTDGDASHGTNPTVENNSEGGNHAH
jgi:hypothetical protein